MPNIKKVSTCWSETGETVYCIIEREADGYLLNDADGAFAGAAADPYVALTEHATIKGLYELDESRSAWDDGKYRIVAYKQSGASPAPASDTAIGVGAMYTMSDTEITAYGMDVDLDTILARLTDARATKLDNLDASVAAVKAKTDNLPADPASNTQVATRLAAVDYTAPDNAGVAAVKAKTDNLPADPASNTQVATRLAAADYTAPDNAGVAAVYAEAVTHPTLAEIEASTVLAMKTDVQAITPISVLPFNGSVQASYAQSSATVELIQGDSVSIPYDLATDLAGYTVWFAAKKDLSDAAYAIAVKEITASVTDIPNGRGTIPLTTAETALAPGTYAGEVEIRKGADVLTAMKFTLKIKGQVITA